MELLALRALVELGVDSGLVLGEVGEIEVEVEVTRELAGVLVAIVGLAGGGAAELASAVGAGVKESTRSDKSRKASTKLVNFLNPALLEVATSG
jgi:hypothetical protein